MGNPAVEQWPVHPWVHSLPSRGCCTVWKMNIISENVLRTNECPGCSWRVRPYRGSLKCFFPQNHRFQYLNGLIWDGWSISGKLVQASSHVPTWPCTLQLIAPAERCAMSLRCFPCRHKVRFLLLMTAKDGTSKGTAVAPELPVIVWWLWCDRCVRRRRAFKDLRCACFTMNRQMDTMPQRFCEAASLRKPQLSLEQCQWWQKQDQKGHYRARLCCWSQRLFGTCSFVCWCYAADCESGGRFAGFWVPA